MKIIGHITWLFPLIMALGLFIYAAAYPIADHRHEDPRIFSAFMLLVVSTYAYAFVQWNQKNKQ